MEDHPLIVKKIDPFNAEPSPEALCRSEITPDGSFFVRSHGDVPSVDLSSYRLSVEGAVPNPL